MAALTTGDVVQAVLTWDTPLASVAQNVWHYQMVSGAGADSADLITAILTQQQVAFALIDDSISNQFEGVLIELRKYDFTLSRFDGVESIVGSALVGLSVTDFEPHGVAALGRVRTVASRRQGRTFIPGLAESAIGGGVLVAATEAALAAYLAVWDTDISITGGLFSWCTFNVEATSPVFETASLAAQVVIANSLPSYLGKRKPGVGL